MSTKWFEIESTYYDDLKNLECLLSTKENRLNTLDSKMNCSDPVK